MLDSALPSRALANAGGIEDWAAACSDELHWFCICCRDVEHQPPAFGAAAAQSRRLCFLIGCHSGKTRAEPQETAQQARKGLVGVSLSIGRNGQQRLAAASFPQQRAWLQTRGCWPCLLCWANQGSRRAVALHQETVTSSLTYQCKQHHK